MGRYSLADLNVCEPGAFVALLGHIYEHSPWIAEAVCVKRPFASTEALHAAMEACVASASRDRQRALISAHPELLGRFSADAAVTGASRREQAAAGLMRCTPEELAQLSVLNARYREKFGFPFVMSVRGYGPAEIIAELSRRLEHDSEREHAACLDEIARIARHRLRDVIRD